MTNFIKILRSVFRAEVLAGLLPAALLLTLSLLAVLSGKKPQTVQAGTNQTDSVYYISNPEASQENRAEDAGNSRNVKNYVLCIRGGVIGVFEEDGILPLRQIDTPPERLPPADRILLERGIRTDSVERAFKLLEDYE